MEISTISLFDQLCHYDNLYLAYWKARKGKTQRKYVLDFEEKLQENLLRLQQELQSQTYHPKPLETFILRDPKTRKISKSDFRDRVVHHALCNIIEPLFEKGFIYDSYANRRGKGTLKAVQRFDEFKKNVSKNNTTICFVLKADIKHYFETVDHDILLSILSQRIHDEKVLWLTKIILSNHSTTAPGTGMPLGNLTSQFFANIYLNELDQFVKHTLKARYYIRYVDDFVILHSSSNLLKMYEQKIGLFLREKLALELHPHKSKIVNLESGVHFLGFRIFYHYRLIRKKNMHKSQQKFRQLQQEYQEGLLNREKVIEYLEGWLAFASQANTYKYRRWLIRWFNQAFPLEQKTPLVVLQKHQNLMIKSEESQIQFTVQKTLQLFRKCWSISQIARARDITESTVWAHLANLVEHYQIPLAKVIPKEKIIKILPKIRNEKETLKEIKQKINDASITYEEINCGLASIKAKKKKRGIVPIVSNFQRTNCYRKCYFNPHQRKTCAKKFELFCSHNSTLKMNPQEFVDLFQNHMTICVLPVKERKNYVSWREFRKNTWK
ncbi:helix-turn-helix domain-containing protein [Candidatus Woesearchaeota archaeon]|nr:helix-turn-helix domain-containing protein [Candidatus Woesearchaeota archaeon]